MRTKKFWIETSERAVKTFAQSAAALLTAEGLGVVTVDWIGVLSVASLAGIVSILTSVASAPVGDSDTPSLTK